MLNNTEKKFRLDISRFDIVEINEMLTYEVLHKSRVAEISEDLARRKVLINPVIYDPKIKLLIDGHHRVDAFKQLNYKYIATFNVDYFSNKVTVENWYRIISGLEMNQFKNILYYQLNSKYISPNHNNFFLEIENSNDINQIPFSDPLEISSFLECLCDNITREGGKVQLSPKKEIQHSREFLLLSINPIIGKNEVFNVAISNKSFHFQVNRHLINNRPLGINLPLEIFKLPKADALSKYREHISQNNEISIEKERWIDERFYEESIVLFLKNRKKLIKC